MKEDLDISFGIKIDFEKNSEQPTRVFYAMAGMIESFQEFDLLLANTIHVELEPILVLQEIETGSILAKLSLFLKNIDNDALGNLDWKKIIGSFLVKGKEILIKFLDEKESIKNLSIVRELQDELFNLAQETHILDNTLNSYAYISAIQLLQNLNKLSKALQNLIHADNIYYSYNKNSFQINTNFNLSINMIENIMIKENIQSNSIMILKVRKPDFLGETKWEFKHGNVSLNAKVIDDNWLQKFKNRSLTILPGDSIRANVLKDVNYGHNNEIVSESYFITEVFDILPNNEKENKMLFLID